MWLSRCTQLRGVHRTLLIRERAGRPALSCSSTLGVAWSRQCSAYRGQDVTERQSRVAQPGEAGAPLEQTGAICNHIQVLSSCRRGEPLCPVDGWVRLPGPDVRCSGSALERRVAAGAARRPLGRMAQTRMPSTPATSTPHFIQPMIWSANAPNPGGTAGPRIRRLRNSGVHWEVAMSCYSGYRGRRTAGRPIAGMTSKSPSELITAAADTQGKPWDRTSRADSTTMLGFVGAGIGVGFGSLITAALTPRTVHSPRGADVPTSLVWKQPCVEGGERHTRLAHGDPSGRSHLITTTG